MLDRKNHWNMSYNTSTLQRILTAAAIVIASNIWINSSAIAQSRNQQTDCIKTPKDQNQIESVKENSDWSVSLPYTWKWINYNFVFYKTDTPDLFQVKIYKNCTLVQTREIYQFNDLKDYSKYRTFKNNVGQLLDEVIWKSRQPVINKVSTSFSMLNKKVFDLWKNKIEIYLSEHENWFKVKLNWKLLQENSSQPNSRKEFFDTLNSLLVNNWANKLSESDKLRIWKWVWLRIERKFENEKDKEEQIREDIKEINNIRSISDYKKFKYSHTYSWWEAGYLRNLEWNAIDALIKQLHKAKIFTTLIENWEYIRLNNFYFYENLSRESKTAIIESEKSFTYNDKHLTEVAKLASVWWDEYIKLMLDVSFKHKKDKWLAVWNHNSLLKINDESYKEILRVAKKHPNYQVDPVYWVIIWYN